MVFSLCVCDRNTKVLQKRMALMTLLFPEAFAPYMTIVLRTSVLSWRNTLSTKALALADLMFAALKSRQTSSLMEKKLLRRIYNTILIAYYVNILQI